LKQNDDRAAACRLWWPSRVEELAGGGMRVEEIVEMEKEFLRGVGWQLRITVEEYEDWLQVLRDLRSSEPAKQELRTMQVLPAPVKERVVMMSASPSAKRIFAPNFCRPLVPQQARSEKLTPPSLSENEQQPKLKYDHSHEFESNLHTLSVNRVQGRNRKRNLDRQLATTKRQRRASSATTTHMPSPPTSCEM